MWNSWTSKVSIFLFIMKYFQHLASLIKMRLMKDKNPDFRCIFNDYIKYGLFIWSETMHWTKLTSFTYEPSWFLVFWNCLGCQNTIFATLIIIKFLVTFSKKFEFKFRKLRFLRSLRFIMITTYFIFVLIL